MTEQATTQNSGAGRHAKGGRARRGLAPWLILTIVVVALIAVASTVYIVAVNRPSKVADCTANAVLPVTASPAIAPAIAAAAAAFDATKPISRSTCITTKVTSLDGATAATDLAAGWKGVATPGPALWVPDSSADLAAVDAGNAALTAGHSAVPLATSPVVLAVRTADRAAASAVIWKTLPTNAGGADPLTLSGGAKLSLALPAPATNRATEGALLSMISASTGAADPAAVTAADVTKAAAALHALAAAGPSPAPSSTAEALTTLAGGHAGFTAVPALEADLATLGSPKDALSAVYPAGPTTTVQILPAAITAGWVTEALGDAAANFDAFLGGDQGLQILANHGFRVPGHSPTTPVPGVDLTKQVTVLPDSPVAVRNSLAAAL